jgi:hypothetical protein
MEVAPGTPPPAGHDAVADDVVLEPGPIIRPGHTFATITDKISAVVLTERTPRTWIVGFAIRVHAAGPAAVGDRVPAAHQNIACRR